MTQGYFINESANSQYHADHSVCSIGALVSNSSLASSGLHKKNRIATCHGEGTALFLWLIKNHSKGVTADFAYLFHKKVKFA